MKSQITADYVLIGASLDPDRVTALLGLRPRHTWRAGDQRGKFPLLRHVNNGWMLGSELPVTSGLSEHMEALLGRLSPVWAVAVALGEQFHAEFSFAVYCYGGDRPAIHFDPETIRHAAELGAALDLDLYIYPEDPSDEEI
jgi:hypothetical protein